MGLPRPVAVWVANPVPEATTVPALPVDIPVRMDQVALLTPVSRIWSLDQTASTIQPPGEVTVKFSKTRAGPKLLLSSFPGPPPPLLSPLYHKVVSAWAIAG